ncbi:cystathionine beta-lyase [Lachnoclostridium sp. An169]|uniref:trans-sulfuration enzyme family protein n=1 Tax=Lachnoclostridium sp. An169 TaxID=1965569 RepID=UPI000B3AD59D|nr:PLP-dependent aspartate aminotransferase family protein [Lachnoclostridium sp. An169]OUP80618.1 cystathionine beta-lyase [Lachnoclostridium sp. An169]HJA66693.1 PLP-dependent aspartate aminotransferase family protein [Candidatus Mediterraneibacter cottocaccae]
MINDNYYESYDLKEDLHFDSKVVHGGLGCDPITGAVSFPIFQTATFRHRKFGVSTGYDYSRLQNPTRQELERTMAILEEGTEAFAFTSGQAANMCLFGLLKRGDHVILSDDIYGGTFRICEEIFSNLGCEFTYVEMSDLETLKKTIRPTTRMIFVETPTNPMMKVADIRKIADIAKENGAYFVVDNTFLTPYFQRPLTLGADIVVHSGTKYLCGHNDVIAGIAVVKTPELAEHFRGQMKSRGNGLGPFDSWLIIRGLKTLSLRMQRHNENAKKVAAWLRNHPKVKKIYYVGFEDHPGYEVNLSQATGFGGMISFELDSEETAHRLLSEVKMILFAESLGGTETLVTYPLTQTHESIPDEIRQKLGINERFIRISIGIEDPDDIIADLKQALG